MVSDEELKKIQWNAKRAVDDMGKGATITLAMDPAVVFALVTELLRLRRLQVLFEDTWEESRNAEPR